MGIKVVAQNKKAHHEYHIGDKFEAGVELRGTEVKSIRQGKVNLQDGWIDITSQGEAILRDAHISHYSHGNQMNHEEKRPRRLLLHHREIDKLRQQLEEKGMTVVPLKIYLKGQWIKVEIGIGKGKKLHDKRETSKKKEAEREIQRHLRQRG